ncbi:acyl-CoA dehydrogenase, N-terminal domain protein [Bordetella holmesii 70147]|nr:acyl-CoA dehydrogenase, N-terminal domain protein [Bordetella holmesii 70147]
MKPELAGWLSQYAEALDSDAALGAQLLPRLAAEGIFGLGVPADKGGRAHSDIGHAIEAIAELASYSLTAALSLGHNESSLKRCCVAPMINWLP